MRVLSFGFIAFIGATLAAQVAPVPPIRSTSNEVLLDLVVRDKHEKAIRNLTPADVEVYEDGVRQQIRAFRFVEGAEARAAEERLNTELKDAGKNSLSPVRQINLVTLVFKQMSWLNRKNAKDAAEEFLNNELLSNTYVGIFSLDSRLHAIHQYSNDRAELLKAVSRAASGAYSEFAKDSAGVLKASEFAVTGSRDGATISGGSIDFNSPSAATANADTGESAAATVMYGILNHERMQFNNISGMQEMDALQILIEQQSRLPGRKTVVLLTPGMMIPVNFPERFRSIISAANRANVTFYGIDVNGLTTFSAARGSIADLSTVAGMSASQSADISSPSQTAALAYQDDRMMLGLRGNTQEGLRELAESTGGFLIANTNNFKNNMRKVMEDVGSHYELAYAPVSQVYDGRYRNIEVRVNRGGARIQSRQGYFAMPDLAGRQLLAYEVPCLRAIEAKPRPHAFDFRSAALRFRPGRTIQYGIVFEVAAANLSTRRDEKSTGHLLQTSMLALIRNPQQEIVEKLSRDFNLSIPDARLKEFQRGNIIYRQPVFLPPGRYTLEAIIADRISNAASVQKSVLVIPAAGNGPEISTPTLVRSVEPRQEAAELEDPFDTGTANVTPTLANGPRKGSPASIYFIVYPSPESTTTPAVVVEFFQDGKLAARDTPQVVRAAGSTAIPMMIAPKLPPGNYDIRITAVDGKLAARQNIAIIVE